MSLREELQTSFGKTYSLERELGGGMSRVFVAEETALGRRVVVKVLPADAAGNVSLERFKREIRVAASLQHTNIVPVLSAGVASGLPYYTMPFVRGESLRERLGRGSLGVPEVVAILRDVARALAYAHSEGVAHRDIKPENILLSGNSSLVTDFGIAKALAMSQGAGGRADESRPPTALTAIGTVLGTPAYMAPEQIVGDPELDHRADLYSLGVVAYELLAGEPPFAGRSPQATLTAHVVEDPVPLSDRRPDLAPALSRIVMSCLAKDPAQRPTSAADVLEQLDSMRSAVMVSGETPRPTIAVLPLANMSSDADDEFFADGVTEDIIAQLSLIRELRVISRTSVMRYKNTRESLGAIARELRASHVLEGSVRRAGSRLRIVAQLINPRTDDHLWSQTFDRELTNMFAVQTEIAERIAAALEAQLTTAEQGRLAKRPTRDMEAYNLFLLGRQAYHNFEVDSDPLAKSRGYLQAAIERDPTFAHAYAWLALVHMYHAAGYWGVRPRAAWSRALPAATKAFELDPDVFEAHVVFGWHAHWGHDFAAAASHFERARAINPNDAWTCIGFVGLHAARGNLDDMRSWVQRGEQLDPFSPLVRLNAITYYWIARLLDDAQDALTAARGLLPEHESFLRLLESMILVARGRTAEAKPLLVQLDAEPLDNWRSLMTATHLALCGEDVAARARLDALHAREATEYIWAPGLAAAYGALGDLDRAFGYLERGYEDRAAFMTWLSCPCFDSLRDDPRFGAIARRIG